MITIDANLYMLKDRLNISGQRLVDYTAKSVDEIVEAEAAQGNVQAANYGAQLFTDVNQLVKVFKLADAGNKLRILSQMSVDDLKSLLPLLDKEDLAIGLNFFTQEKLLTLLQSIPKEQLVKVTLELFSQEELLKLMPDKQIDKFFKSEDLDKGMVLKYLKQLPPEMIAQMIENATGKPVKDVSNQQELIKQMATLPPDKYKDALLSMNQDMKRAMILAMTAEDPKLFQIFDADAFTNIINFKQKPEITQAMGVIDEEHLLKMIDGLPQELMAVVLTQIDADTFADMLINDFPEMLAQIAAG